MPFQASAAFDFAGEIEAWNRSLRGRRRQPRLHHHGAVGRLEAEQRAMPRPCSACSRKCAEMILEPSRISMPAPFCEACEGAAVMAQDQVLAAARRAESRPNTTPKRPQEIEGVDEGSHGAEAARRGARSAAGGATRCDDRLPAGPPATGRSGIPAAGEVDADDASIATRSWSKPRPAAMERRAQASYSAALTRHGCSRCRCAWSWGVLGHEADTDVLRVEGGFRRRGSRCWRTGGCSADEVPMISPTLAMPSSSTPAGPPAEHAPDRLPVDHHVIQAFE